MKIPLVGLLV